VPKLSEPAGEAKKQDKPPAPPTTEDAPAIPIPAPAKQ